MGKKRTKDFDQFVNNIKKEVDGEISSSIPYYESKEATQTLEKLKSKVEMPEELIGMLNDPQQPVNTTQPLSQPITSEPLQSETPKPVEEPTQQPPETPKPQTQEISTKIDKEEGKSHVADVPLKVDTFFGIANLVEAQTHLEFSAQRCLGFADTERENGNEEKAKQFEELSYNQQLIAQSIRHLRGSQLSKFLTNIDEDIYCYEKHMMESTVRFMEVAEKMVDKNDREQADKFYKVSDQCHTLFWLVQELPRIEDIDPALAQPH